MPSRTTGLPRNRAANYDFTPVNDGNFDYEEKTPVDVSQKGSADYWVRPDNGITEQRGPFIFNILPTTDRYLAMNRAALEIVCRIVKKDGTECSPWKDIVAPVNLLGAAMWKEVVVRVNDKTFEPSSCTDAGIKAFIETVLSYDSDARTTHLSSQFWHLDTPYRYDDHLVDRTAMKKAFVAAIVSGAIAPPVIPAEAMPTGEYTDEMKKSDVMGVLRPRQAQTLLINANNTTEIKRLKREHTYQNYFVTYFDTVNTTLFKDDPMEYNVGFSRRFAAVSGSSRFDMFAPITHDFFRLDQNIGPGNKINIELSRYPDEFLLNTFLDAEKYRLEILDLKLHLHSITRRETIQKPVFEAYHMNETQLHRHLLGKGAPSASFRIHHGGVMPKNVILAMVSTTALHGSYLLNPFLFHHYHIKTACLNINGDKLPRDLLRFDFDNKNPLVSHAYHWMFSNTGAADADRGNCVSWQAFQGGCFLMPFDLTPDTCNGLHNHDAQRGYIDVEMTFAHELPESIYVLYELVFPKLLKNNKLDSSLDILDIEYDRQ